MEPVTFDLVIFDLDGTLTDTSLDLTNAINLARRELGLPDLAVADVVAAVGNGAQRMVENIFGSSGAHPGGLGDLPAYLCRLSDGDGVSVSRSPRDSGCAQAKNIPMGVISNKSEDSAREVLRHLSVDRYFFAVLGDDGKRPLKPDPAPVHEILMTSGCDPVACLMVGDSRVDIECARNAGIRMAFLADRMGQAHQTLVPDFTMRDTREILTLFAG